MAALAAPSATTPALEFVAIQPHLPYNPAYFGDDLASTGVAKPEVHAEHVGNSLNILQNIVANDDNYALAA